MYCTVLLFYGNFIISRIHYNQVLSGANLNLSCLVFNLLYFYCPFDNYNLMFGVPVKLFKNVFFTFWKIIVQFLSRWLCVIGKNVSSSLRADIS